MSSIRIMNSGQNLSIDKGSRTQVHRAFRRTGGAKYMSVYVYEYTHICVYEFTYISIYIYLHIHI